MHCREFEARLQAVLDARRKPEQDRLLVEHAHCCAACRQTLAAQRRVWDVLARTRPFAEEWEVDRVVARLRGELPARHFVRSGGSTQASGPWRLEGRARLRARSVAALGALIAASLALGAVGLWLHWAPAAGEQGWLRLRAERSPSPHAVVPHRPLPDLPALVLPRRSGSWSASPPDSPPPFEARDRSEEALLPWHPAELLLEAPRLPAHWQAHRPTVDELVGTIPRVAQQLDHVESWAPGLRPLRLSLVRVWEVLWSAAAWGPPEDSAASGTKSQTGMIADFRSELPT